MCMLQSADEAFRTMARRRRRLFGTSGIRGGLDRVDIDLALGLGRALGSELNGNATIAVATDARTSRTMLLNAFVSGALSTGVNVVNLGVASMPNVAFFSSVNGIDASVIITASHNPPSDNGFKFFKAGREFTHAEESHIENRIFSHDFRSAPWHRIGRVLRQEPSVPYMRHVREFLASRGGSGEGTRVLVDLANGAASSYTPRLLGSFGFSVVAVNSHQDGHFPGRPAEPSPKNLEDTMQMTAELNVSVALCHDGDGDRVAVLDEDGSFIDQNRVIAVFARDELERRGSGVIVVSIDTSSVIDEIVSRAGGEVVRVPLGSLQEQFVGVRADEIVFASEPWKPIFVDLGLWMDGTVGAVRFAQLVKEIGYGSCKRLMASIPKYPMLREHIDCPDDVKRPFMDFVLKTLPEEIPHVDRVLDIDGVRVECSDGSYVLVRVSGTEPKARLYAGARTEHALNRVVSIARSVMHRAIDSAQRTH